ncbi:hypothetical protein AVEN_101661-1 [Araneus ventricosus]|uniref:Uncharacterized protein n=1 Tax=Araneus ventricosus TaxID=182803 RepID=A0A4Y2GLS4_ARAVE|nr:hypothetical protein AVEN_101661-1 [Araneus ventricosus]
MVIRRNIKLDNNGETAPSHLERFSSHCSNFQHSHLGGSFMEAPCKPLNQSLRSTRATVPTPPPSFKAGSPVPLSQERQHPFPHRSTFCERASLPLPQGGISVLWPYAPNEGKGRR